MFIQETARTHKTRGTIVGVALLLFAIVIIAFETSLFSPGGGGAKMFVSSDDGATYETASVTKFPPYTSGSKTYVRAVVFNDGSKPFVGYLLKYGDTTHDQLEAAQDKLGSSVVNSNSTGRTDPTDTFVKRPGDRDWTPLSSAKAVEIQSVKDSQGKKLQPLVP